MVRRQLYSLESITFFSAILGILVGALLPSTVIYFAFLGSIFLLLLKMIIIPLIVVSVFLAIAKQNSSQEFSKIGLRTLVYFLSTGAMAALTGVLSSSLLPSSFNSNGIAGVGYDPAALESITFQKIVLSFFTANPFQSLVNGEIIQIVVVSLFFGVAALALEQRRKAVVLDFFESLNDMISKIIKWILFLAPIGIFALVASLVAQTSVESFLGLGWFFLATAIAVLVHVFITLPIIGYYFGGFHPYKFIFNVKEALIVALATASSSATLPVSTRVLEVNEKVRSKTTRFVLPLGATLNMDGSALYQTLVIVFLGAIAGVDFTILQKCTIVVFVMFSSAGTAGIPGGGLMMMSALLSMLGIPLELIGFYLLIDRFWDPIITAVNVLGDLFAAKTIDHY